MAKVSPVTIKYMIYSSFKAEGPLEKPDVIGAIFGQTEGLLGSDMEMRELQKEGKIGRIEVNLEIVDGKSVGEIQVPTAMDKSETTLIAAALETIDRIGPTEASIETIKIEDVRGGKRDYILERAKKLLEVMENNEEAFGEINKTLKEESRVSKIQEYGEERLPAGDLSGNEVIVVEGRADVVNLLKNRVNNVIGMNGTKLPKEISKLGEEKELTLFIDGDRGGKLIANNVINNAKIAYVAVAPDGKEVEELTGKEIIIALRRKISVKDYLYKNGERGSYNYDNSNRKDVDPSDVKKKIKESYEKIRGSKNALLVNEDFEVIKKVSNREVTRSIKDSRKKPFVIIIDGSAMSAMIKACDDEGIPYLAATNFSGNIEGYKVKLISL